MNLVLTFYVGPKANSNASTHTNYLITLLKNEVKKRSDPFSDLTHNYTDESGPLNSPRLPVYRDFLGLAEGHRAPSERGIIAGKSARSTPYFQSCEPVRPCAGNRHRNDCQNGRFSSAICGLEAAWMVRHSLILLLGLPLLVLR